MQEMTRVDGVLTEFIMAHQHYEAHPELLKDNEVRNAYNSLMGVHSQEDLTEWMRLMYHIKDDGQQGGVRWENVLGRMETKVSCLDDKELQIVAAEIGRIADNRYEDTFSDDLRALSRQRENKVAEGHVAVFSHGDNWFAFGKDADRIFEAMGWQTSEKLTDEGAVSWMNIGYEGMTLLNGGELKVQAVRPDVGIHVVDWSSDEDYKADRLSLAQQTMDYLRMKNLNTDMVLNIGQFPVNSYDNGIESVTSIGFIRFHGMDVDVFTENGKTMNLVSGQQWNVAGAMDFIISTGDALNVDLQSVEQSLVKSESIALQRQLRTDDVLDEYHAVISKYRYDHVLMEQKDFYEAFGDDAVSMAKKYHLPLWDRDNGNGQAVPTVILNFQQIDRVLSVADDVLIEESKIKESKNGLALKPSPLNEGLHSELRFNESGIKKTRSGEYLVWARLNGVELPDMKIPAEIGVRYSRLTAGAEKEITLRTVLQQTYGSEVTQLQHQGKSASVKI